MVSAGTASCKGTATTPVAGVKRGHPSTYSARSGMRLPFASKECQVSITQNQDVANLVMQTLPHSNVRSVVHSAVKQHACTPSMMLRWHILAITARENSGLICSIACLLVLL